LVEGFPDADLWPVLLRSLGDDSGRPWHEEDLCPVAGSGIAALDARTVRRTRWSGWLVPVPTPGRRASARAPFGAVFPGPVPALSSRAGGRLLAEVVG